MRIPEPLRAWVGGSLVGALTFRFVLAFAVIGVLASALAYRLGQSYADLAYDRSLTDDVDALARQVRLSDGRIAVNLPEAARTWLISQAGGQVLFRIVDLRANAVTVGNADLGPWRIEADASTSVAFRNQTVEGLPFRIGATTRLLGPEKVGVLIEVGETLTQRAQLAQHAFAGMLALFVLTTVIMVILVWRSITDALRPLKHLEVEAAARSGSRLEPLDPQLAPAEVRELILAINRMMLRLSDTLGAQRRFTANVAHQLRTPIAALRLHAQLARDAASDAELRQHLLDIESGAGRASHVVDQLLTLTRAERGALPADLEPVDLFRICAEVIERHLPAATRKGIDLGYAGDGEPVPLTGNATLLAELVGNLVDNAVRCVQAGGTVTVAVTRQDPVIGLQVIDNGPGIGTLPAELMFERLHRSDTAGPSGLGLGLAIVREIAALHGGGVAWSAPPGGGLCVTVTLQAG